MAHNAWSDKNIVQRGTNWWLLMKKGMHWGIPKLRRLSLLEYLLGLHGGIPNLERLTLQDLLSSPSIAHLKTPFIHNSSLKDQEVSTVLKKITSTGNKDFQEGILFLLIYQKFLQRKSKLKICKTAKIKTGAEAEKKRTVERKEFFWGNSATQIKKLRTNAWKIIVWSILSK